MLKERYIKRNAMALWQNFLRKNYKKAFLDSKKLRFLLLLVMRKVAYKLMLSNAYIAKVRKSYTRAEYRKRISQERRYYLLPLCICHKLWLTFVSSLPMGAMVLLPYVWVRYKIGKVDIPYFELVLTTRCTMRCESCNNLMQYFDSKNAYTCSVDKISETLEILCRVVDSVAYVRLIGGEPLLFKDIARVVEVLERKPKIKTFDIVTNGTIKPSPALLEVLAHSYKSWVSISDYTSSPNLTTKLHIDTIAQTLSKHHIPYHINWQDSNASWWDPGRIYKRNRDKEGIINNFKACLMPCVSVMSNEGFAFRAKMGGGNAQNLVRHRVCKILHTINPQQGRSLSVLSLAHSHASRG